MNAQRIVRPLCPLLYPLCPLPLVFPDTSLPPPYPTRIKRKPETSASKSSNSLPSRNHTGILHACAYQCMCSLGPLKIPGAPFVQPLLFLQLFFSFSLSCVAPLRLQPCVCVCVCHGIAVFRTLPCPSRQKTLAWCSTGRCRLRLVPIPLY
ncbi:uncharacterized protein BO66DRAFT_29279 [Aspergillus aculeatinus CBS 121060]|uniref:Uncharacterized protein n=1 Tax=Aspergillus aculeatinus CBS 121060 TaxID=1448322 RepID=A0ACD1GQV7_9EURO|nr:hypothetical protein BO66DRAFT_29279 [Aspergillus aculeatinus CBS 121060]RAH63706.1 hypothetical protein BO66DRAFT_29279 [Aspergillus aculeatinus CBS 121060]